jgi:hypothetical protein
MVVEKISRPALFCNPREGEKKIDSNLECEWDCKISRRERFFSHLHPHSVPSSILAFPCFILSALKRACYSVWIWNTTWNVNVQIFWSRKNLCRRELRVDFHAFFFVYYARASLFLGIEFEIPWKVNLILGESGV